MLEWTGDPCIDTLGIPCGSEIPIAILFFITGGSINAAIICFASASSIMLRDANSFKFDAGFPLFWCP